MIRVATSVRGTLGGLWYGRVAYEFGGVMQAREGASAFASILDAWHDADRLKSESIAFLHTMGYGVAV